MSLSSRMSPTTCSSHAAIIKTLSNRYHETKNPNGFVNLAVAENTLMHEELTSFINNNISFDSSSFMYGNGGAGSEQLRSSIASFMNARFHPVQPLHSSSILCTSGMTSAIEGLAFALADGGDAFLLARPYYGSFPHVLRDRPGVQVIGVSFGEDIDAFSINAIEAYESALDEAMRDGIRVRGIILCNPHNPLGHAYSKDYLKALMSFAGRHQLHIISDEIYALSSWNSPTCPEATRFNSILTIPNQGLIDPSYVHCLWGMSKDFGASGFRIAAVISPNNEALLTCLATRGLYTFPSGPTDTLVAQILSNSTFCDDYFARSSTKLSEAHKFVTDFLDQHDIAYAKPGGSAIFVWINLGMKLASIEKARTLSALGEANHEFEKQLTLLRIDSSQRSAMNTEIAARLVKHKVYLANGDAFGSEQPGWFRIVFSHDRSFVEIGLKRMLAALEDESPPDQASYLPATTVYCCMCV